MSSIDVQQTGKSPLSVTHRAGWVMAAPDRIFENGYVTMQSGTIIDVGQGRGGAHTGQTVDHGPGVLMPSLVNAHTHLELTALQNKTCIHNGFISWVQSVIKAREAVGELELLAGVQAGIEALSDSGALVIGDISSTGMSRKAFCESRLSGAWFREYLGPDKENIIKCEKIRPDQSVSLAGHGPHTTASDLLVRLKSAARAARLPFSLHLAESTAELEFLTTGKGEWANFLKERCLDPSIIKSIGVSPVEYADRLGLLDETTLAVHLVFANKKDILLLQERNVSVCLCLRSNDILHHRLPDVESMVAAGLNLCLGTDSLASSDSLSMFDEMRFLSRAFPGISPGQILSMATTGGARALGYENRFGRLSTGFAVKMIYVPVAASAPGKVLQCLVNGGFTGNVTCMY